MENITNRYVVHLDILGMRVLVGRNHKEAWDMLSALEVALKNATNLSVAYKGFDGPAHIPELIRSVVFSDTVVLYSASDTVKDFIAAFTASVKLFAEALYLRIPVRIGISKGLLYTNETRSMYAGPALIEAYELGEKSQWLGVTVSEAVACDAARLDLRNGPSEMIVPWAIPTKSGPVSGHAVNWPVALASNFKVDPPISTEQLYQLFEEYFGPLDTLGESERLKYANTVEFLNAKHAAHNRA